MNKSAQQTLDTSKIHGKRLLFVTGKLAAPAVESIVRQLADEFHFHAQIQVLPITVAALMTSKWVLRKLTIEDHVDYVVVPGYLGEDVAELNKNFSSEIVVGPRDIRDLPELFGRAVQRDDYGRYRIEILAEINYANRFTPNKLLSIAQSLVRDGADIIDLGCEPGIRWQTVSDTVRILGDNGIACSIDTFDPWEAAQATSSGARLVLSVNSSNRVAAVDWNAEVVVVPDVDGPWMESIRTTIEYLASHNVPHRIDPILEPLGCGFTASLERYIAVRREFPSARTLMGIGNITELTDVDSAGINVMLLGICEEIGINSILTTQVINWARSSVAECNIARQLVHYACEHQLPPKRLDNRLIMLRDPKLPMFDDEYFAMLAASIKDNNYRIMIDGENIHLLAAGVHIVGRDPFVMIDDLLSKPQSSNVDRSHAFYLGFELCKAATALQLGKRYEQDENLHWGFLTERTTHHRLNRKRPS